MAERIRAIHDRSMLQRAHAGHWLLGVLVILASAALALILTNEKDLSMLHGPLPADCTEALAQARACWARCWEQRPRVPSCGLANNIRMKHCDRECQPEPSLCDHCLPKRVRYPYTMNQHPDAHLCEGGQTSH